MADIIALDDYQERKRRWTGPPGDRLPDLRVVITMRQLCAAVAGASVLPGVPMLPQAQLLFDRFLVKAYGPRYAALERLDDAGPVAGRGDALVVESVLGGTIYIADTDPGGRTAAALMRRHMIGVPDEALLARQRRTGQPAVAFASLEALAATIRRALQYNRPLISHWTGQGAIHRLWLHHRDGRPVARIAGRDRGGVTEVQAVYVLLTGDRSRRRACVHIGLMPESLAVAV